MNNKQKIYFDMDGVLAKWNSDSSIEEVTAPGYFINLEPQIEVIEAVKKMIGYNIFDMCILSSVFSDDHSIKEKEIWLDKWLPEVRERLFVPLGVKKTDFVNPSPKDILVDDFTENLIHWKGIGVKLLNGINGTKGTWKGCQVNGKASADVVANTIISIYFAA